MGNPAEILVRANEREHVYLSQMLGPEESRFHYRQGGADCLRDSRVKVCSLTEAQNLHIGFPSPPGHKLSWGFSGKLKLKMLRILHLTQTQEEHLQARLSPLFRQFHLFTFFSSQKIIHYANP